MALFCFSPLYFYLGNRGFLCNLPLLPAGVVPWLDVGELLRLHRGRLPLPFFACGICRGVSAATVPLPWHFATGITWRSEASSAGLLHRPRRPRRPWRASSTPPADDLLFATGVLQWLLLLWFCCTWGSRSKFSLSRLHGDKRKRSDTVNNPCSSVPWDTPSHCSSYLVIMCWHPARFCCSCFHFMHYQFKILRVSLFPFSV